MQHVPTATVPLRKERIARLIGIASAEVAQEAFMVVILDVLQPGFRNVLTIYSLVVRVAEQT